MRLIAAPLLAVCALLCMGASDDTRTFTGVMDAGGHRYLLFEDGASLGKSDTDRCITLAVPADLHWRARRLDRRGVVVSGVFQRDFGHVSADGSFVTHRFAGEGLQDWCGHKLLIVKSLKPASGG
ncbi:MAG: hypothetical protein JWP35_410 [Caulobacter sp.]|nr:hypothetical protein [Caulobacter sp.]